MAATQSILIINGPNLNMLGTREPEIYGKETLDDISKNCVKHAATLSLKAECVQSNVEGELVGWIQQAPKNFGGLIINPGAYGHTSIAIMDALLAIKIPAIEVHLSNIYKREEFRHHTYTSKAVTGIISGLGSKGYVLAIDALAEMINK